MGLVLNNLGRIAKHSVLPKPLACDTQGASEGPPESAWPGGAYPGFGHHISFLARAPRLMTCNTIGRHHRDYSPLYRQARAGHCCGDETLERRCMGRIFGRETRQGLEFLKDVWFEDTAQA